MTITTPEGSALEAAELHRTYRPGSRTELWHADPDRILVPAHSSPDPANITALHSAQQIQRVTCQSGPHGTA